MVASPAYAKYPDHSVELESTAGKVRVEFAGETIAESTRSLHCLEADYPPVVYVPREDVRTELLEKTGHTTYCPFKGTARYWSITVGEKTSENAVWGYDAPYGEVAEWADYVAFYLDRIDAMPVG